VCELLDLTGSSWVTIGAGGSETELSPPRYPWGQHWDYLTEIEQIAKVLLKFTL
jgi:hypothetical protein